MKGRPIKEGKDGIKGALSYKAKHPGEWERVYGIRGALYNKWKSWKKKKTVDCLPPQKTRKRKSN